MARVAVTFAESAVQDLEEILAWYESQLVLEVGRQLTAEIFMQAERLAENPDIGRVVSEFGQTHIRELIYPPFRIVYKRDNNRARIVRVWRSERLLIMPEEPDS